MLGQIVGRKSGSKLVFNVCPYMALAFKDHQAQPVGEISDAPRSRSMKSMCWVLRYHQSI